MLLPAFIDRLEEPSASHFEGDAVKVLEHNGSMLLGAEEIIRIQSYQHPLWNDPVVLGNIRGGLGFRFILPRGVKPPPSYTQDPETEARTRHTDSV